MFFSLVLQQLNVCFFHVLLIFDYPYIVVFVCCFFLVRNSSHGDCKSSLSGGSLIIPVTNNVNRLVFWRTEDNHIDISAHTEEDLSSQGILPLPRDDLRLSLNAAIIPSAEVRFSVL